MGIYVCCFPMPPPRGAGDETVLSWDVPPKCSGGTTHSGRCHWESACDNTEGPLTPRRASTTLPSGGTQGATGSNGIRSTPSSLRLSCNFFVSFPTQPLLFYMVTSKVGLATLATKREIAGISSSGARVHAEVQLLPPSFVSCSVPIGCLS